jgi:hypothetical protein
MNDKQVALEACDSAQRDRFTNAASVYAGAFLTAEGKPNADALRNEAGERFKVGLRVLKAARDSSRTLVGQVFP